MDYRKFTLNEVSEMATISLNLLEYISNAYDNDEAELRKVEIFVKLCTFHYDCYTGRLLYNSKKPE